MRCLIRAGNSESQESQFYFYSRVSIAGTRFLRVSLGFRNSFKGFRRTVFFKCAAKRGIKLNRII